MVNPTERGTAQRGGVALFLVPSAADRRTLGRSLAAPLLSSVSEEVARARLRGHPDLLELIAPDGKERIGIDQVRDLIRAAQFSPVQAGRKVCLIPRAESLTQEASNALLKTMEEPPRDLAFVLLADHPSDLLPTIVSRSRIVRLAAATSTALQERFQEVGYPDDIAAWLARQPLRDGEAEALIAETIDVAKLLSTAAATLDTADTVELLESCLSGNAAQRRVGMLTLLKRLQRQDLDLLTSGVRMLATQDRETLVRFLHELLLSTFDALRDAAMPAASVDLGRSLGGHPADASALLSFCLAIGDAHQSLLTYGPVDGNLLSLFLGFKGADDAR